MAIDLIDIDHEEYERCYAICPAPHDLCFVDRDLLPKPGSIMPRHGATSPEGEELT